MSASQTHKDPWELYEAERISLRHRALCGHPILLLRPDLPPVRFRNWTGWLHRPCKHKGDTP